MILLPAICACKPPNVGDATCSLKDYCAVDTPCSEFDKEATCSKLSELPFFSCTCSNKYTGDRCTAESNYYSLVSKLDMFGCSTKRTCTER